MQDDLFNLLIFEKSKGHAYTMKKITEMIIRKDSSINKVQFDEEWFYAVEDMADYLNEDLTGIEYVHLPIIIDGIPYTMKCATWEDIERIRQKELLEDYKGSTFKKK